MLFDFETLDGASRYKLMSGSIVPRPIAWITTEDEGTLNLAPFSYFTPLSSNPATVIVSIGHKEDGSQKDTLANILRTKRATISFVNPVAMEDMEHSAFSHPKEVSETQEHNIQTRVIKEGYPPMVESSEHAFCCEFYQKVDMPGKTVPVVLELKYAFFKEGTVDDNQHVKVDPIGRVGNAYAKMQEI